MTKEKLQEKFDKMVEVLERNGYVFGYNEENKEFECYNPSIITDAAVIPNTGLRNVIAGIRFYFGHLF